MLSSVRQCEPDAKAINDSCIRNKGHSFAALSVLFVCLVLSACAATGPAFQPVEPQDDKSLIYLYREGKIVGSGHIYTVLANQRAVAHLASGGYYPVYLEPGEIEFRAVYQLSIPLIISAIDRELLKRKVLLRLTVRAGEVYYVRLDQGIGYVEMSRIPYVIARDEIKNLNLSE